MKHTVKQELSGVLVFVAVMWAVYFLDFIVPGKFEQWGIIPRTLWGLLGIPLSPFIHAGFGHILGNSIPLVILLALLAGSRTRTWPTVMEIVLLGGGLLWLFGRASSHVGASGLIYGLIAFLLVAGFREKRLIPLAVALLVGFLYGGTLISGVLPTVSSHISWEGHLFGAIAGAAVAYVATSKLTADEDDSTINGANELRI